MAPYHWWKLQGVFCVYKPNHMSLMHMRKVIITNLVNDLQETRFPLKETYVSVDGRLSSDSELEVNVREKLSVHPLAVGTVYRPEDIKVLFANALYKHTSGVCVAGVSSGTKYIHNLIHSNIIRTYRLTGLLGKATDDLYYTGKVVEKSKYSHVTAAKLNKILMVMQASHQRRAMECLGYDIQSQEAYEALSKEGIVRPQDRNTPLVYSIQCVDFDLPNFTVELACINENEVYLLNIIHNIGLMLKTNATTTKLRCIRYGPFNVDHALLHKHWRLLHIIQNIEQLESIKKSVIIDTPDLKPLHSEEKDT